MNNEQSMQAVIAEELGTSDKYHLRDIPRPRPGPKDLLIKVHVSGMGYVDALVARGLYQVKPDVPYCPGLEFSGEVAGIGEEVQGFSIGQPVSASGFGGGLAEYAVVPAKAAFPMPAQLPPAAAAGFIVNYTTAWHGLLDRGQLKPGETVLVLGAAGGTGLAALQVARMMGANVIGGASTQEKRRYALEQGAHLTLDYSKENWRDDLKAMTGGRGVDVVFDPVGGELLEPAFRSLAWRGRYLVIGFAGGTIPSLPANLPLLKGSALIGVDYRQFGSVYEPDNAADIHQRLFAALERGDLAPPVGESFAFQDYRAAIDLAASRDGLGKTTIRICE